MSKNFLSLISQSIDSYPNKAALNITSNSTATSCTYAELGSIIAGTQRNLVREGFKAGDRAIVLFPPSIELYGTILAMVGLGCVPVFVDTSMPFSKITWSIENAGAKALMTGARFRAILSINATARKLKFYRFNSKGVDKRIVSTSPDSLIINEDVGSCLITYTSGSTGNPKAADRTHYSLIQQSLALSKEIAEVPERPDDATLVCFPVALLQCLCTGSTGILPAINLRKPGLFDPKRVLNQITDNQVTILGGSSAFLERLCDHIVSTKQQEKTSNIRMVFCGGAPVGQRLAKKMTLAFPEPKTIVIYGSTEAEPISHSHCSEYLCHSQSKGLLVGSHVSNEVDLVISDPGADSEENILNEQKETDAIGEIYVMGNHVLQSYINPADNIGTKIQGSKGVWHATGDRAYFDDEGLLWLVGRTKDIITHRGKEFDVYALEHSLELLAGVNRAAVVQTKNGAAAFFTGDPSATGAVSKLCREYGLDIGLSHIKKMPVDGRHNSKIDRKKLSS